jgi:putative transposase
MQYHHPAFLHCATVQLHTLFSKILNDSEAEVVRMQGETECVYLLVKFPPKITISALVSGLKGSSSWVLYKFRPDTSIRYHQFHFF